MPGTAVSHLIFFIVSVVVATSVVGALLYVTGLYTDSMEEDGYILSEGLRTQIKVINDPVAIPYNNTTGRMIIYVKNVGMRTINPNSTVVLVDGLPYLPNSTAVLDGHLWSPGKTLEIYISVHLEPGDHRLKVIVEYGKSDTLEFRM